MFRFFASASTAIASAAVVTLLFGLLGVGITGSTAMFNPNLWTPAFQGFAGVAAFVSGFVAFICSMFMTEERVHTVRDMSYEAILEEQADSLHRELIETKESLAKTEEDCKKLEQKLFDMESAWADSEIRYYSLVNKKQNVSVCHCKVL